MSAADASTKPSAELIEQKLSLGIWHKLAAWDAMIQAIQYHSGGPDTADKRDWLAATVADLLIKDPSMEREDIQIVLLQAMDEEFDVRVEDDSEELLVDDITALWKECLKGDFTTVDALQQKWVDNKGKEKVQKKAFVENNQDTDGESLDDSSEDDDVDMDDAPELVPVVKKEKAPPQVDDDGFTKVTSKRGR